jgi:hypothetical protein
MQDSTKRESSVKLSMSISITPSKGQSTGRLAVVMSTPTIEINAATHLPLRIHPKIRPVPVSRFVSAFGNRRASFIQARGADF